MSSLREKLASLPTKPGVYLFKDRNGTIIYVGKAKSLRKRVASYFRPNQDLKTSILLDRLHNIDFVETGTEMAALVLEDELVKKYRPRYNISLKDDKAYPFIKLTINEEWPRLLMVRRREPDGALYFGRFRGGMVRSVISLAKKILPIRWCKESPLRRREQPCLYYRIGSCSGPCIGKISRADYMLLVKSIVLLLNGKIAAAVEKISDEMKRASQNKEYEKAAYLRDRIRLLEKMMEGKTGLEGTPSSRLLAEVSELQRALKLEKLPTRIEAFDISNISGTSCVASMVTFFGGMPLKHDYRRFRIRGLAGEPNDPAAMAEVVLRRYSGTLAGKMDCPDLVMVDGGLAQVNAAERSLKLSRVKRPVIGLAKREEEIYFPGRSSPLRLPRTSGALMLLQRIRDESHRFALAYHKQRRSRALFGR